MRAIYLAAARSFYQPILEESASDISLLPEVVRARGAKPHWLGHLAVADVSATIAGFVARGALERAGGTLLRDPSGAVLTLTSPREPARGDVVWSQLFGGKPERAKKDYGDLCGMTVGAAMEVPEFGTFHQFGWGSGPITGSMGDIAGKPHIHPQYLQHSRRTPMSARLDRTR